MSNNTFKYINLLPRDILKRIYNDYILPDLYVDTLLNSFDTKKSTYLDNSDIIQPLKNVLNNKLALQKMLKIDYSFKLVYNYHYIDNKIYYLSMCKLESMILNCLTHRYH